MIETSAKGYSITGYWNKYAGTWMVTLSKAGQCAYGSVRLRAGEQNIAFGIKARVTVTGRRYYGDLKDAEIEFYAA